MTALRPRYDNVQVALHWITVILVLFQFASSLIWEDLPRPMRRDLIWWHMSLGVSLGAVVVLRLVWRLLPGHGVAPASTGLAGLLAGAMHWGLYGLLIAQFLLGFAVIWSEGEAMMVFGIEIAPLIPKTSRAVHRLIAEVHEWTGYVLVALAFAHGAMAVARKVLKKDGTMARMMPGLR